MKMQIGKKIKNENKRELRFVLNKNINNKY